LDAFASRRLLVLVGQKLRLVDDVDGVLAAALERPVAAPPVEAAFVGAEI
jgi:hypothetical protein